MLEESDVSGYSDGVTNVTPGRAGNNVTMDGVFDDAANMSHDVFIAILGFVTTKTSVKVDIGIMADAAATNPEFLGEFYLVEYSVAGDLTWHASFMPAGATLGIWGTWTASP